MRRVFPALLVCCLASVAHAAPEAAPPLVCPPIPALVHVKITSVDVPTDALEAINAEEMSVIKQTPHSPPQDYLLLMKQAAAKSKVTLTITPGPTVTTTDGVKGELNMQAKYPYTVTDTHGKKQPAFQTIGSGVSVLPRINPDGTITVQLSVTDTKETGPSATPDGPLPLTTQSLSTIRTFTNGQTMNIGGLGIQGHASRLIFATITVVSPVKQ